MDAVLWLLVFQGILGAFDLVYHHEITEKLTWKPAAAREMHLHGLRNGLYAVIFISLGFTEWHGWLAWVFAAILLIEVGITLCDFVLEDQTRRLPASERVTHTVLALNYGAVIALLLPQIWQWGQQETGFSGAYYGFLSWVMGLYSAGVFVWFLRDYLRARRLARMAATPPDIPVAPELQGKHILLAGGTGFLGRALCRALVKSGCRITVLTRDPVRAAEILPTPVTLLAGPEQLSGDEAFDAVINLAGEPVAQRWTEKAKAEILASRLDMTQALTAYIEKSATKPELFLNSSAIGWYGTHSDRSFTEDTPPADNTAGAFAKEICAATEAAALAAEEDGVRTVLLRTGIVLEIEGGTLSELLFPFDFCTGGPLGSGRQWFSWIHRNDWTGIVLHILTHPDIHGAVNATAPQPVTNREFSTALGRAMRRPAFLPLPAFVLRTVFGEMADEIMLNGQKVLPEKIQKHGYRFLYPDITSALSRIFAV